MNRNIDKMQQSYGTYVCELRRKFKFTGPVPNKKRLVENSVGTEAVQVTILSHIAMEPTLSAKNCQVYD